MIELKINVVFIKVELLVIIFMFLVFEWMDFKGIIFVFCFLNGRGEYEFIFVLLFGNLLVVLFFFCLIWDLCYNLGSYYEFEINFLGVLRYICCN